LILEILMTKLVHLEFTKLQSPLSIQFIGCNA